MSDEQNVDEQNVVVQVALEKEEKEREQVITLNYGIRATLRPVAIDLLNKVQTKVKDPPVPTIPHPNDDERFIENPVDPEYLAALEVTRQVRHDKVMEAMVLFGLELLDPMPKDETWLENLVYTDVVTQEQADNAHPKEKEIWFKRWVALDASTFQKLQDNMGLTQEMVAEAAKKFQLNS